MSALPARNSGLGYASVRSRWSTFGCGATWRSEIRSRRSAPRRIAGDIGVFWRRPPSVKNSSPIFTAGNRSGIAADASTWRGPIRAARWRTNGSRLHSRGTGSAHDRNTTVWPVPTCVADTEIAWRWRPRRLRSIPRHGIVRSTKRSRPLVSSMPP